jgi:hypothetical protein
MQLRQEWLVYIVDAKIMQVMEVCYQEIRSEIGCGATIWAQWKGISEKGPFLQKGDFFGQLRFSAHK